MRTTIGKLALTVGILLAFTFSTATAQTPWDGSANTTWYNTSATAFTITTAEELAGLAQLVNGGNTFEDKTITLGNDIVLNSNSANYQNWEETAPARSWVAIGNETNQFKGTFDGNGYVVSGVYINATSHNQGLFGYLAEGGTIKNIGVIDSYIKGVSSVGGLVGDNWRGTISNSYSSGKVTGTNWVGGLVGMNNSGTVSNSYSTGTVAGTSDVGGLVGANWNSGTVSNGYYDTQTSGRTDTGKGIGKTTAYMQSEDFVNLLNTGANLISMNAWVYSEGKNPELTNRLTTSADYFAGGEGTKTIPYIIETKGQLESFSIIVNSGNNFSGKYFKLGNDIALNGSEENPWTVIGTYSTSSYYNRPFQGTFDGDGHVISGVYINGTSNYQGLFGYLGEGGTIKNLGVDSYIKGGQYVGGLVGYITNGTVSSSYSIGTVTGTSYVGGLVGYISGGSVGNSYSIGMVTGTSNVGGLVGYKSGGIISFSYYDTETSGRTDTGKGIGKITEEMQSQSFVNLLNVGASFLSLNTWVYSAENYPVLSNIPADSEIDFASCFTGAGTEASPYIINTKEQLEYFSLFVNSGNNFIGKYFKLGNDIALNGTANDSWTAIGSSENQFKGTFNGDGHVVSGVYRNLINSSYQGLFGYLGSEGVIKNIGVVNSYIVDSYNQGFTYLGGLVGCNYGTISNSYSTGTVTGSGSYIGGLVGENRGTVNNSYSTSMVTGSSQYSQYVGGLVGGNISGTTNNSYSTGKVTGTGNYVGGLVGGMVISTNGVSPTVSNSYYDKTTSGRTDTGKGIGKTTDEMQSERFVNLLNIGAGILSMNAWVYSEEKYPELTNTPADAVTYFASGDGTEASPYIINTKEQLEAFSFVVNFGNDFSGKYFKLGNYIALNGTEENQWTTIGNNTTPFRGTFDGNGNVISGVYINGTSNYQGLFGYLGSDGVIKNIGVAGSYIKGGQYVGCLVGISGGTVSNSYSMSVVTGTSNVGGLIGYISGGTVNNSYSTGAVTGTGSNIGGMVGYRSSGTITNSYYDTETSGQTDTGKGTGKTTDEMKQIVTYVGWDFRSLWDINSTVNNGYPHLDIRLKTPIISDLTFTIPTNTIYNSNPQGIGNVTGVSGMGEIAVLYDGSTTQPTNAGTYTVTVDIIENSEFTAGTATLGNFTISPKPVIITGLSAAGKEYDGTTTATITGTAIVNGAIDGDDISVVSGTANFANLSIGNGKTVTFSGFSLTGTDVANYTLSQQPANVTANMAAPSNIASYFASGDGTETNSYIITTKEHLENVSLFVSLGMDFNGKHFKLGNDIPLNGTVENPWTAIGNNTTQFRGIFDGNGNVVSGIYINGTSNYQGLFGYLGSGCVIKNVGVLESSVKGSQYIGGLVGYISGGSVDNSYSAATVTGTNYVGGLVGYNSSSTVRNSYSAGTVTGTGSNVGGLVGYNSSGIVSFSYYDITTSGQTDTGKGVGKTTVYMQSESFANQLNIGAGFISMNAWVYSAEKYPKLTDTHNNEVSYFASGDGTEEDPYIITTKVHLENLSHFVNLGIDFNEEHFKLSDNIDLNSTAANPWASIGNNTNQFKGTFDGNGNVVSGVYINSTSNYQGLFGYLGSGGVIKNVGVVSSNVKGGQYVGGLVGYNYGTVSNSYYTGTVTGTNYIGGLVGYNSSSAVRNSYSAGTITGTGSNVGGLVGYNSGSGIVSFSYYDITTSGQTDTEKGTGKTTGDMQSESFANLLNAGASIISMNIWFYSEGEYPALTNTHASEMNYFASGDGTEEDPYIITTKEHLENLSHFVNLGIDFNEEHFKLSNNIALNGTEENPWTAIGNSTNQFKGIFDGNGHVVSGVYVGTGSDYAGLFGYLGEDGIIKNIGVTDSYAGNLVVNNDGTVINSYSIGGSVGSGTVINSYSVIVTESGSVSNIYFDNTGNSETKTTTEMQSKEFAYFLNSEAATLSMNAWVYSSGEYPALNNTPANIASYIASCFASGNGTEASPYIINTKEHLEFLSSFVWLENDFNGKYFKLDSDIALNSDEENSWTAIGNSITQFKGTLDGDGYVVSGIYINTESDYQGLFGYLGEGGVIKNVGVIDAYIEGGEYVGGLVGNNDGTVSNSYFIGEVTGNWAVNDFVGYNYKGTIFNSYSIGTVTGSSSVSNNYYNNTGKTETKTTTEMQSQMFVSFLNIEATTLSMNNWVYSAGKYPTLSSTLANTSEINIDSYFASGDGTEVNPYIINTKLQLETLSQFVNSGVDFNNKYFKLGKDIALNGTAANPWIAIGNYTSQFKGTFDGNGHVVSGVYINGTNNYQGLFGYLGEGGTIKNIGVIDSYVEGDWYVGGLVGSNYGTVSNSYFVGEVTGDGSVGGMVGYNYNKVKNCYSISTLTGNYSVGGLVGGGFIETNSYYEIQTGGQEVSGTGKTTEEMKQTATYVGWDFRGTWDIDETINSGYPYFNIRIKTPIIVDLDYDIPENAVYNSAPQSIGAVTGADGMGAITIRYNGSTEHPTNAGTYVVTAHIAEGTHFEAAEIHLGHFVIEKAHHDMSGISFDHKTVEHTGDEHHIYIDGELPDGVHVTYHNNGQSEHGEHHIRAVFTSTDPNYHHPEEMVAKLTIQEATPTIPNRANPEIGSIGVQTIGGLIMLTNLPPNAKVEVYNLNGKRVYSNVRALHATPQLSISVQTKGLYIVRVGTQTHRVTVK